MNQPIEPTPPEYCDDAYEEEFEEGIPPYPQEPHSQTVHTSSQGQQEEKKDPLTMNIIVKEVLCCVVVALLQGGLECLSRRRSRLML